MANRIKNLLNKLPIQRRRKDPFSRTNKIKTKILAGESGNNTTTTGPQGQGQTLNNNPAANKYKNAQAHIQEIEKQALTNQKELLDERIKVNKVSNKIAQQNRQHTESMELNGKKHEKAIYTAEEEISKEKTKYYIGEKAAEEAKKELYEAKKNTLEKKKGYIGKEIEIQKEQNYGLLGKIKSFFGFKNAYQTHEIKSIQHEYDKKIAHEKGQEQVAIAKGKRQKIEINAQTAINEANTKTHAETTTGNGWIYTLGAAGGAIGLASLTPSILSGISGVTGTIANFFKGLFGGS